jgi:hypothetical protein
MVVSSLRKELMRDGGCCRLRMNDVRVLGMGLSFISVRRACLNRGFIKSRSRSYRRMVIRSCRSIIVVEVMVRAAHPGTGPEGSLLSRPRPSLAQALQNPCAPKQYSRAFHSRAPKANAVHLPHPGSDRARTTLITSTGNSDRR